MFENAGTHVGAVAQREIPNTRPAVSRPTSRIAARRGPPMRSNRGCSAGERATRREVAEGGEGGDGRGAEHTAQRHAPYRAPAIAQPQLRIRLSRLAAALVETGGLCPAAIVAGCRAAGLAAYDCIEISVRYASVTLLRSSVIRSSERLASSVAAITWWISTFSPRRKRPCR